MSASRSTFRIVVVLGAVALWAGASPPAAEADSCGGEGQIACLWGCDAGLEVRADLLCHAECGGDGEAACGLLPVVWCDAGHTLDPERLTHCTACGGENEYMCVNLVTGDPPCDFPWLGPELVWPVPPLYRCRVQWQAEEPDCDCDVEVGPQPARGPVYGVADTHAHQFSNMAFGGALLWGRPFDERGINGALAPGGFTWDFATMGFLDPPVPVPLLGYEVHFDAGVGVMRVMTEEGGFFHGSYDGADSFSEWPRWNTTLHQQMYHRWLERAYRGGLRLMVMLAVNNEVVCELPVTRKRVVGGDLLHPVVECEDMYTVDEQLAEARALERFVDRENDGLVDGDGWYRIVTSPYEARKAIREGKMAVVLGIEVDGLFGCEQPWDCDAAWVASELERYRAKGVRHLFPVHLYNNGFGGSAVYNELWPYTSPLATGMPMPAVDCEFVKEHLLLGPLQGETAAYEFKLVGLEVTKWFLEQIGVDLPVFEESTTGHCNPFGLTLVGAQAVEAMMDRRMIVDVDHLSLPALDQVLLLARLRDYPLISGHSFLHERPITEHGKASSPSEGHKTALQIDLIRELGGVVAPLNPRKSGSSTRDYVHMYRYAVDKMRKGADDAYPGIAYASDWGAMYLQTAPRCPEPGDCAPPSAPLCRPYDTEGCVGSMDPDCKVFDKELYPETGCKGKDFPRLDYGQDQDGDGVEDGFQAVGVVGSFRKQRTGSRTFDFNEDGLAHVGLLPDFLKDLTLAGLTEQELEPLFHSAEAYIRMWEKIHGGPPKITPVVHGTPGRNGWYVSDVRVEWMIESEAEIRETDGCGETIVDYDTAGIELTCWAASDGGESEASVLIKRDTAAPVAGCEASPSVLYPPNGKMVAVTVATSCTDALSGPGPMPVSTAASSEADRLRGRGDRPGDIQGFIVGSLATDGALRAERFGSGPGRTYTLGFTCFDMAGNAATCATEVLVPHDRRR